MFLYAGWLDVHEANGIWYGLDISKPILKSYFLIHAKPNWCYYNGDLGIFIKNLANPQYLRFSGYSSNKYS